VVFIGQGAFIRVFDHESPMTPYRDSDYELWPGLLDGLPAMLIAACPDPECGAPAEIIPWAIAGSTNGPVPHVRTDDHVGPAPRAR
jgi:hypothetical protein